MCLQTDERLLQLDASGPSLTRAQADVYDAPDGRLVNTTRTYAEPVDLDTYFAARGVNVAVGGRKKESKKGKLKSRLHSSAKTSTGAATATSTHSAAGVPSAGRGGSGVATA